MAAKIKKGHPDDDFGTKLRNDPDKTPEQVEAELRQRKLSPVVKADYLNRIGGEPPRTVKVICVEINKGRWRITIYTTPEDVKGQAVTPSPHVTHSDAVTVDNEGYITAILPSLSKGRHYPMSDCGHSGKRWS